MMMTAPITREAHLVAVTPRLRVKDVVLAAEYYRDFLGFTICSYEQRPPVRALLVRDQMQLVLDLATWDATHGPDGLVDLEFAVDDLSTIYEELRGRGLEIESGWSGPVPWCAVKDADGHTLRFAQR